MTNPISKAIVKAAVAMGYGKKSDYKGSSVADVLEKFAAIAKDKGGSSGGGVEDIEGTTLGGHQYSVNKTMAEIASAMEQGARICASGTSAEGGVTQTVSYYLSIAYTLYQDNALTVLAVVTPVEEDLLVATESDGVTTFAPA